MCYPRRGEGEVELEVELITMRSRDAVTWRECFTGTVTHQVQVVPTQLRDLGGGLQHGSAADECHHPRQRDCAGPAGGHVVDRRALLLNPAEDHTPAGGVGEGLRGVAGSFAEIEPVQAGRREGVAV